jgi:hypothetical protein
MKEVGRCFVCILIIMVTAGCLAAPARTTPEFVEFGELVADPQRYDGSEICTEGIHAMGFETNALGASTYDGGNTVYLTEPTIWIEGAEIRVTGGCLESGDSPRAEFCPVQVCGVFEAGRGFGHLGGYKYQLRGPGR